MSCVFMGKIHTATGPYDEYCPPGQHILCPPQARNREECTCLDDEAVEPNHMEKSGL